MMNVISTKSRDEKNFHVTNRFDGKLNFSLPKLIPCYMITNWLVPLMQ